MKPYLLTWDSKAQSKADSYLANSTEIQQRIAKTYGRESEVIFPPYFTSDFTPIVFDDELATFIKDSDYFLVVSRLMPYKNVDQIIQAFANIDEKLLVIGSGPLVGELRAMSTSNVHFASNISDSALKYAYSHCKALIAASYEDFGLTPLEVGSFGKPTIALRAGGYLDTIQEGVNGQFFDEPTAEKIRLAVDHFDEQLWSEKTIKNHIENFSEPKFIEKIREYISQI